MGNTMETAIANVITYYNEMLKMILLSKILWDSKLKEKKWIIPLLLVGGGIVAVCSIVVNYDTMENLHVLLMVVTTCFIIKAIKIRYAVLAAVIIAFADCIVFGLSLFFFHLDGEYVMNSNVLSFCVNAVMSFVLMFLWCLRQRIHVQHRRLELDIKTVCILVIGTFAFGLYIAYVESFGLDYGNNHHRRMAAFGIIIGGVIFFIATYLGIFFQVQNKQLKNEIAIKDEFLSQQKMYYMMLLEKEENTKKFRHDIRGHINSMRILAEEKDYAHLEEYIDAMDETIGELQIQVQTGNSVVNAIVADMQKRYENVYLQWDGLLKDELKIRPIDLCIIFSNLLSNAFRGADTSDKPVVYVEVKIHESNVAVIVRNRTREKVQIKHRNVVKKVHKEGHGYGIENVKDCIKVYEGTLTIQYEEQEFIAEIYLPDTM